MPYFTAVDLCCFSGFKNSRESFCNSTYLYIATSKAVNNRPHLRAVVMCSRICICSLKGMPSHHNTAEVSCSLTRRGGYAMQVYASFTHTPSQQQTGFQIRSISVSSGLVSAHTKYMSGLLSSRLMRHSTKRRLLKRTGQRVCTCAQYPQTVPQIYNAAILVCAVQNEALGREAASCIILKQRTQTMQLEWWLQGRCASKYWVSQT